MFGAKLISPVADCPGYCDNSLRIVLEPKEGGGEAISVADARKLLRDAEPKFKDPKTIQHAKRFYIISKQAIEEIFNNDNSATGLMLANYFDNDKGDPGSLNLFIAPVKTNKVEIKKGYENIIYQIKTFCPEICDESMHY